MNAISRNKTPKTRRTAGSDLLVTMTPGAPLLGPLTVAKRLAAPRKDGADARITLAWGEGGTAPFAIETKRQNTPLALRAAMDQARRNATRGDLPMIVVPYLSPQALAELEAAGVSGVDLCGNGLVIVPGRLYVQRSGQPNRFPQSRPLNNPYRGRSAMVARMLLAKPTWPSLNALAAAIRAAGCDLSLPQASKAIRALADDLMVAKDGRGIRQIAPLALLDNLGAAWRTPRYSAQLSLRLAPGRDLAKALSTDANLGWAVTGASSVQRYATFAQGGPRQIAVSDLAKAQALLGDTFELVSSFADVELIETDEPGFFFMNEIDDSGLRWASKTQTWLELRAGDARQRQAADEIYRQLCLEVARG
jgi:hypothetical protein